MSSRDRNLTTENSLHRVTIDSSGYGLLDSVYGLTVVYFQALEY